MLRFVLSTILCLGAVAALAADAPRKIDFTAIMVDQDNEAMLECTDPPTLSALDPACKAKRPITLGLVAMRVLSAQEDKITPEDSLKRGQLALSVYKSAGAELTAEEIALIKRLVAKFYSPLVVARAFPLLDPAAK